jgi:hypothetical protein
MENFQSGNELDNFKKENGVKMLRTPVKQGFWQRHPILKKFLIGAAIGFALVATAAIVAGAIVTTGGAGAVPIIALAAALKTVVGLSGAIGVGVAAGVITTCYFGFVGLMLGTSFSLGKENDRKHLGNRNLTTAVNNRAAGNTNFIKQNLNRDVDLKTAGNNNKVVNTSSIKQYQAEETNNGPPQIMEDTPKQNNTDNHPTKYSPSMSRK